MLQLQRPHGTTHCKVSSIQAALHENEAIGRIMESVIRKNENFGDFQIYDSRKAMIEAIKKKWNNITSKELEYIESMFERAVINGGWKRKRITRS